MEYDRKRACAQKTKTSAKEVLPAMDLNWEDGSEITVRIENGAAIVAANAAGLR